jgi:Protein of unknown function (DUF2795)
MTARRLSSKHGPRLDEQLKQEVDPLVHRQRGGARPEEDDQHEGVMENDPDVSLEGVSSLSRDPALARRELSRHLRLSVFPADRHALLAEAEANDAPDEVIDLLARLPRGMFGTVHEVWEAVGGESEPIPHGREKAYGEHHRRSSR